MEIRHLVGLRNKLGEGPLWDARGQLFYWVDILGSAIHCTDADGGNHRSWTVPEHIGAMTLREGGGAVLALRKGFHSFDFDSEKCEPIHDPEAGLERTRFNDGKTDRRGRFIAGTMDYEESDPLCSFYRLDPDFTCTRLGGDVVIFNAPCWSPDDKTFYYADSSQGIIFACDYDIETGTISNQRVLVAPHVAPGVPDGCTVDAEGYLWNARWGAGRVVRFTPDGRIDRILKFPANKTTSCAFGSPDLNRLYVTSMQNPDGTDEPDAGVTYVVDGLGVKGLPEPRFAG